MFNQSRKIIIASTIFTLSLASTASYADDDERKGRQDRDDGDEYIAITLQTDPTVDSEAACVALKLGANLLSSSVPDGTGTMTSVEPAEKVVLFPTLGGVQLVNPDTDLSLYECNVLGTPEKLDTVLNDYISAGGEIIVCPLCAFERNPQLGTWVTDDVSMGNGVSIHELFIDADKVIDF